MPAGDAGWFKSRKNIARLTASRGGGLKGRPSWSPTRGGLGYLYVAAGVSTVCGISSYVLSSLLPPCSSVCHPSSLCPTHPWDAHWSRTRRLVRKEHYEEFRRSGLHPGNEVSEVDPGSLPKPYDDRVGQSTFHVYALQATSLPVPPPMQKAKGIS